MKIIKTSIEGLVIIEPKIFKDSRGYFFEPYNKLKFDKYLGKINFVQDNESKSERGVLRGFHFQKPPYAQAKLVRCIQGEVIDIALDLRKKSNTYGKYHKILLSSENKKQFFVPRGFAHGFVVLSEIAILSYKVDNYYNKESSRGIAFDDPELGINWEIKRTHMKISIKDKNQKPF